MADKDFPFIVFNGPKLKDPDQRKVIRKQAMKDAGQARKKRGNYGKVNLRQIPVFETQSSQTDIPFRTFLSSDDGSESHNFAPSTSESSRSSWRSNADECDEEASRELCLARRRHRLDSLYSEGPLSYAAIVLFSNYETARAKFTVDVTDLAILTNFNVGKSVMPLLTADPARMATLLGYPQWSYMEWVPSLYGSSPCLTAATNCLLAKVKGVLSPYDHCKQVTMRLYAKALRTLQDAISDESACIESDVLCATQLLSLYELLDPTRDAAWSHHVGGSARIITHRTPQRFKTDFDKALFAAHVGPIISECLVENKRCYLEDPEWLDLYRSMIKESDCLSDRSALTINARSLLFPLPGLWRGIGEAVTGTNLFDDEVLDALAQRCRRLHERFIDWMEEYKAHCVRYSFTFPPRAEINMRRELFGVILEGLILVKRLLATVCDEHREQLETETQALALLIIDLQKQPQEQHSWLFAGHETGMAYSAMLTKDQWEKSQTYDSDEDRRLAIRTRFTTFTNTLRMTG